MSRLESCPHCLTERPDWDAPCPRCHYDPATYNRAQDDVALIFRLNESDRAAGCAPPAPPATSPTSSSWFSWLPWWPSKRPPRPAA
jgi:hypothetical protein